MQEAGARERTLGIAECQHRLRNLRGGAALWRHR